MNSKTIKSMALWSLLLYLFLIFFAIMFTFLLISLKNEQPNKNAWNIFEWFSNGIKWTTVKFLSVICAIIFLGAYILHITIFFYLLKCIVFFKTKIILFVGFIIPPAAIIGLIVILIKQNEIKEKESV